MSYFWPKKSNCRSKMVTVDKNGWLLAISCNSIKFKIYIHMVLYSLQEHLCHSSLCSMQSCEVGEALAMTSLSPSPLQRKKWKSYWWELPQLVHRREVTALIFYPGFCGLCLLLCSSCHPFPGAWPVATNQGPICGGFRHFLYKDMLSWSNTTS